MSNVKSFTGFISIIVLAASLMTWGQSAHATLVTTSFSGTVTVDNVGVNPFGLAIGDAILGSATYDDALVVGNSANEEIFLSGNAGWDFSVTLGSFSFTQADVTDSAFTSFFFNMSAFDGLAFNLNPINIGNTMNIHIEDFSGGRSLFAEDAANAIPVYLQADWDFQNATTVPVVTNPGTPMPVPGTLALLGLGIVGLRIVGRRKRV